MFTPKISVFPIPRTYLQSIKMEGIKYQDSPIVKITYLIKSFKSLTSDYAMLFPKSVASYSQLRKAIWYIEKCIFQFQPQVLKLEKPVLETQLAVIPWASYFSYLFNGEKKSLSCRIVGRIREIMHKALNTVTGTQNDK